MTKAEQKESSLGGAKNLGSNRNTEGTRQVTNRERVPHQSLMPTAHPASVTHPTSRPESTTREYSNQKARVGKGKLKRAASHWAGTSPRNRPRSPQTARLK